MTYLAAKPVDRSATKPIYVIVAKDATVRGKFQYYKALNYTEKPATIEFRGWLLTKQQADQVTEKPNATECVGTEVIRIIPWHNIERIDNVKVRKAQGESNV